MCFRTTYDGKSRTDVILYFINSFCIVQLQQRFRHLAELLPVSLQRQNTACPSLEMQVIRRTGTAFRAVVEHHQLRISPQQAVYLYVITGDGLWLMLAGRNGKMSREYRKRIDKNVEIVTERQCGLFIRTVLPAEEARTTGQRGLVNLRTCAYQACRIELYKDWPRLTCLYTFQLFITPGSVWPLFQLVMEEFGQPFLPLPVLFLTSQNLNRPQLILIVVVDIHLINTQHGITVSAPATAEVQLIINPSDTETAAESKPHGIVFTVTGIGKPQLAGQRGEEGTRCTETVDTQSIVAAVVRCPLTVADQARRKRVEIEVAHTVRAYNHRRLLLMEGIDNGLQGVL